MKISLKNTGLCGHFGNTEPVSIYNILKVV